jgi:hypothetical protein
VVRKVDEDVVPPAPLDLDDPDVEDHEFVFMQEGEDGNFWDDDNIAEILGDIDN